MQRNQNADIINEIADNTDPSVENERKRKCSTTSGISSGRSSNSLLSCCNNNEEYKFKNSIKHYDSMLSQKDLSGRQTQRFDSQHKLDYSDDMSYESSFDSCASICSYCDNSNDQFKTCQGQVPKQNKSRMNNCERKFIKGNFRDKRQIHSRDLNLEKM